MQNHQIGNWNRVGVFSHGDIVPFQSNVLTEEFKKKTGIMHASWPLYHYILKAIFLLARSLNVQGKITLSVDIIRVMFI